MRRMLPLLCFVVVGCGPMNKPMVDPLEDEHQAAVDEMWENMLSPVDHLDRMLLLDTVVAGAMFHLGVDRLHLVSEKDLGAGVACMEVLYDREDPESATFAIAYLDTTGRELRREEYTRDEVNERFELLSGLAEARCDPDEPAEARKQRQAALAAERKARMEEIRAAVQPAGEP